MIQAMGKRYKKDILSKCIVYFGHSTDLELSRATERRSTILGSKTSNMVPNAGKCCLHHPTEEVGFCNAGEHLSPVPDQKLKGSLHIVESANKSLQRPQRDPTFGDARHQDDVGQNHAKLQVRIPQWRLHVFKLDCSYRKIQ